MQQKQVQSLRLPLARSEERKREEDRSAEILLQLSEPLTAPAVQEEAQGTEYCLTELSARHSMLVCGLLGGKGKREYYVLAKSRRCNIQTDSGWSLAVPQCFPIYNVMEVNVVESANS